MPIAAVTIQYVNPPKEGRKMGSIKTEELGYIGVWPDKLDLFQKGKRYVVEYEIKHGNDGREFKNFVRIKSEEPQAKESDTKAKDIFVTGVVGRYLQGAGTWPEGNTLALMVAQAREAWEVGMEQKAPKKEETEDFLQDSVPF